MAKAKTSPKMMGKRKSKTPNKRKKHSTVAQHDVYVDEDAQEGDDNDTASNLKYDKASQQDYSYSMPDDFDDEDIDSDDAFDSEDEQKYGDMFASRSNKNKKKNASGKRRRIDPDGSSSVPDQVEDSFGSDEDVVDLSSMLQTRAASPPQDGSRDNESENDGTEFSLDENDDIDGSDSDEDERHDAMMQSLASIANPKRKQATRDVVDEPVTEGEFHVRGSTQAVGMDDLLGALQNSAAFGGLKKKISTLEKKNMKLDRPVADVHVKKATRAVAYEETSKEISKWAPLVKARRELEHLSFPLNRDTSVLKGSNAELAAKFTPAEGLEQKVATVLESAGADANEMSTELTAAEELELRELPKEEMENRVRELRKLRAMESVYAAKCKRIKKIKSKKYHRLKKKDMRRQLEKMTPEELAQIDPDDRKSVIEKAERNRALNRASLRHKNTSKWAKHMLARSHVDDNTKKALGEQLQIDQDLRKKVMLEDSDGDSVIDSDEDVDPEDLEGAVKEVNDMREDLAMAEETPKTGLYGLKFMQRALERKKAETKEALDDLEAELDGSTVERNNVDSGRRIFGSKNKKQVSKTVFKPADWEDAGDVFEETNSEYPSQNSSEQIVPTKANSSASVTSAVTVKLSNADAFNPKDVVSTATVTTASVTAVQTKTEVDSAEELNASMEKKSRANKKGAASGDTNPWLVAEGSQNAEDAESENPWLQTSQSEAGLTPQTVMDKFTKKSKKREAKLQRVRGKDNKASNNSSLVVDVTKAESTTVSNSSRAILAASSKTDEMENTQSGANGHFALNVDNSVEQRKLIEQAFAGDNVVVEEFEEEKSKLVDGETNKDEDVTLPGWGSWGGNGVPTAPKRRFIKKAAPQAPRKDKALKHVIITERKDKKLEKKKVADLPFPYNNTHQFERTIRQPVGREWNTARTTNDLIKPKVATKAGTIIEPMSVTKSVKAVGKINREKQAKRKK